MRGYPNTFLPQNGREVAIWRRYRRRSAEVIGRRRYRPTTLPNPLLAVPCVLLVPAVL